MFETNNYNGKSGVIAAKSAILMRLLREQPLSQSRHLYGLISLHELYPFRPFPLSFLEKRFGIFDS